MHYRIIVLFVLCHFCVAVSAAAQTDILIDLQSVKVNAITNSDNPTFTIDCVVVHYPEFVLRDRHISRSTTAGFGMELNNALHKVDGRVIMVPQLKVDSIVYNENADITEYVIYAQLVNCKLPLTKGTVFMLFPLHFVACYRELGPVGVCNEKKSIIGISY